MARWSANVPSFTPVAVADGTNFTNSGFLVLQGGTTTVRMNILEVYMGGQAGASSVNCMLLARDSTTGTGTTSGARLTSLDPATAALGTNPITTITFGTTVPQRSSTLSILSLSFNSFGGIVRWVAAPGEEVGMLGNAVNAGEMSLSCSNATGTPGAISAHMIFEPF